MESIKVSVVVTVLNEEKYIGRLLESLLNQDKQADEIIVVDAGSKDKTLQIINHFQKKNKKIKLVPEKGNIAHGRNSGIEVASNGIIASTDAGCVAHSDWLEKITRPFERPEVQIVAGFYDMPFKFPRQKAISLYLGIHSKRYDPETFLPSTRSVAFRKQLWESVGGFNERLNGAGEDTRFFYDIVKSGARIVQVGEARVDWQELENISFKEAIRKFYLYAKGDAQTGIWWHPTKKLTSHNIKIVLIFTRYLMLMALIFSVHVDSSLFTFLEILIILYLLWPIWKWRDIIHDLPSRIWLSVIQVSSDFAVMAGFISGIFTGKEKLRKMNK